jgi:phage gp29-like protein
VSGIGDRLKAAWRAFAAEAPERRRGVGRYDPQLDSLRIDLTRGLNFDRLARFLREGLLGEIAETVAMFEEMESVDDRLRSVFETRRAAVLNLEFEVVSAAEVTKRQIDKTLADDAAAFIREEIDRLDEPFQATLSHMARATSSNIAVTELIWDGGQLAHLEAIPSRRLSMKPSESLEIRVRTSEDRVWGIVAAPPQFLVHVPAAVSGSPIERSLMRCLAMLFLLRKLAIADWGIFCELFGMPVRVGRYEPSATPEEKAKLEAMLRGMGSQAWAMVSKAVELELKESTNRGISPYQGFCDWLSRQMSIAALGGNLSSDTTGGTGTYSTGKVQEGVRDDLRDADINAEGRTVRGQIFSPMTSRKFLRPDVPVPYFRRVKPETFDRLQEAQLFSEFQRAGGNIGVEYAHKRLHIPKPADGEEVLQPRSVAVDPLAVGAGLGDDDGLAKNEPPGKPEPPRGQANDGEAEEGES